jgi:exosortase H (IPTLxxWG-CTERM-specific)
MSVISTIKRPPAGVMFIVLFAVLALGGLAVLTIPVVDKGFTQPFTHGLVVICAFLMRLFGGHIRSEGMVLAFMDGPGAVYVSSGCNAVEVCLLFAAAVLAFPAPIKARLAGAVTGILVIQGLNLLRIISLLILARFAQKAFDFFHMYVWDAFIMLDGVLLFLGWHHWQSRRWPQVRPPPTPPAEAAA